MLPWSITLTKSFSVVRSNRTDRRAWEHSGVEETFYSGVERRVHQAFAISFVKSSSTPST